MRVFCIVQYDGTKYYGWERQIGQISIEEEIENALSKIFNQPINIYGSGRTDAGVHAKGQTFHFDVEENKYESGDLMYRLNSILPSDINVLKMEYLDEGDDFHVRYSATSKTYEYRLSFKAKDPFRYNYAWLIKNSDYDLDLLKTALAKFVGKHNFINFTSKEEDKDGFIREIFEINVGFDEKNDEICIKIKGDGFMRYQIRYIVGTAVMVALKKESLDYIDERLNNVTKRSIVAHKAPAQGLYLLEVNYK